MPGYVSLTSSGGSPYLQVNSNKDYFDHCNKRSLVLLVFIYEGVILIIIIGYLKLDLNSVNKEQKTFIYFAFKR